VTLLAVLIGGGACGDGAGNNNVGRDCTDGETRECYGGPDGTAGVGPCKAGLELCSNGRWPGICIGDQPPLVEQCNMADDDCNGVIDDAEGVGDACTGTNGCAGMKMCDAKGSVRCFAPSKNDCDLCGGPDVPDLGDDCNANACTGELVCNSEGNGTSCNAPTPNECALCGGPAVTGLGVSCMSADNCPGTMICNVDGTAAVCDAPVKNECNACFPSIGTLGSACVGDRGCVGATACNGTGDAAVCTLDAPCGHVMLSELATGSSVCSTDEFIELYNPTSRTVSLAGWSLRSRSASSGSFIRLLVFASTATIAPHGYFLVASARSSPGCSNSPAPGGGYPAITGNTVTADATYSAVDLSGTTGGIWLTTIDQSPVAVTDSIVVDVLGYDDLPTSPATVADGTAAPAPQPLNANGSLERKATSTSTSISLAAGGSEVAAGNGYDTDDNSADFVAQALRVPQNAASTPEP
jgi:hypothetical protein